MLASGKLPEGSFSCALILNLPVRFRPQDSLEDPTNAASALDKPRRSAEL